ARRRGGGRGAGGGSSARSARRPRPAPAARWSWDLHPRPGTAPFAWQELRGGPRAEDLLQARPGVGEPHALPLPGGLRREPDAVVRDLEDQQLAFAPRGQRESARAGESTDAV